jgi:hypothetical protein
MIFCFQKVSYQVALVNTSNWGVFLEVANKSLCLAMPSTHTVIIHGWSDCSQSFVELKTFLQNQGIQNVGTIYYADYESREDHLTFEDLADGLNDEFIREGFIAEDGAPIVDLNVIVHSTGGLVIRHWISRYYLSSKENMKRCPVKRIIMLAPANFGSPLAHRGKSFLGSLFKGRWKLGDFLEVGRKLLAGLELGSPYQWQLAHLDILSGLQPYRADGIQVTVLVGVKDYDGLRGWINKPGTDGTVVIAGTTLTSLKLILDCTRARGEGANYVPYQWSTETHVAELAWAALPALDHGSIVEQAAVAGSLCSDLLLTALKCSTSDKNQFLKLRDRAAAETQLTYQNTGKPRFQQFAVRAVDDQGVAISDFTLEFFLLGAKRAQDGVARDSRQSKAEQVLSQEANRLLTGEMHTHSVDSSYRRFLVEPNAVNDLIKKAVSQLGGAAVLSMRIYVPRIDRGISYAIEELQNIVLFDTDAKVAGPMFLFPNTTTLLEVKVNRRNTYVTVGKTPRKH